MRHQSRELDQLVLAGLVRAPDERDRVHAGGGADACSPSSSKPVRSTSTWANRSAPSSRTRASWGTTSPARSTRGGESRASEPRSQRVENTESSWSVVLALRRACRGRGSARWRRRPRRCAPVRSHSASPSWMISGGTATSSSPGTKPTTRMPVAVDAARDPRARGRRDHRRSPSSRPIDARISSSVRGSGGRWPRQRACQHRLAFVNVLVDRPRAVVVRRRRPGARRARPRDRPEGARPRVA